MIPLDAPAAVDVVVVVDADDDYDRKDDRYWI